MKDEGKCFSLASYAIANQIYIDNVMSGAKDVETAKLLKTELLSTAGNELRKWSTKHPKLLSDLPMDHI